ncbi:MAG: glutathione synthase [Hyphomicrobiales bacterium]|nr:MAG: glutathione synthase [Hyphomicrobiales bacterium]
MNLLFIVDPLGSLRPDHDTSIALMEVAQQRGHRVHTTTMADLTVRSGRVQAPCTSLTVHPATLEDGRWNAPQTWYATTDIADRQLDEMDAVLIRTDPPVDSTYLRATYLLDQVDPERTVMVNAPSGLREVNEKLFTLRYPTLIPDTIVSGDRGALLQAVEEWGTAVLKPTDVMAGRGVLLMRAGDLNLGSLIESATADFGARQVILQRYVHESVEGDRRVIVVDGAPVGAIRRVAARGEFRCNMAAGATVHRDSVSAIDHSICAQLAPELAAHGIVLAGIDVIGDRLIEVNVTSPTGVREIEATSGPGVAVTIIDTIERRADRAANLPVTRHSKGAESDGRR